MNWMVEWAEAVQPAFVGLGRDLRAMIDEGFTKPQPRVQDSQPDVG